MMCEHKRIKSVNCVLYCIDCGEKLPDGFMMNKPTHAEAEPENAQETPKKTTRKKVNK